MTPIFRPRRAASSPIFCAPRSVPSPPMAKRSRPRDPSGSRPSPPRPGPSGGSEDRSAALVDPVDGFGCQLERLVPDPAHEAFVAEAEAVDLVHAVMEAQARTIARITSFNPGQRPPHVTIPHASFAGSKNSIASVRRTPSWRCGAFDPVQPGVHPLERGVIEHALLVAGEPDAGQGRRMRHSPSRAIVKSRSLSRIRSSLPTHCIIVVPADRSPSSRTTRAAIAFSARVM